MARQLVSSGAAVDADAPLPTVTPTYPPLERVIQITAPVYVVVPSDSGGGDKTKLLYPTGALVTAQQVLNEVGVLAPALDSTTPDIEVTGVGDTDSLTLSGSNLDGIEAVELVDDAGNRHRVTIDTQTETTIEATVNTFAPASTIDYVYVFVAGVEFALWERA